MGNSWPHMETDFHHRGTESREEDFFLGYFSLSSVPLWFNLP